MSEQQVESAVNFEVQRVAWLEQLVSLSCDLYDQWQGEAALMTLRAAVSMGDSREEFELLRRLVHDRLAARRDVRMGRTDLVRRRYERVLVEVLDLAERS